MTNTTATNYIVAPATEIRMVPTADIFAGDNDRTEFDAAELETLARSLASDGLAQPITVRPIGVRFEIVAGERRFRAALLNGWSTIPTIVRELSDEQAQRIMTLENLHRVNLNVMDEARAYHKWVVKFGYTARQIAAEVNKPAGRVAKVLGLLELHPDVQLLVRKGNLDERYAFAMAGLNEWNQSQAVKLLGNCTKLPTLADWRRACGELLASQNQIAMFDLDSLAATLEGKKARKSINRPISAELPAPDMRKAKGYIGSCMVAYADQLRASGREAEALALYTVTQHLVDLGRLLLDGQNPDQAVGAGGAE